MTEKMKPSGIGWIKDIPESWKTSKVKFLATEPGTLFLDGDWIESDVIEESGIRYLTSGNVGAGFYKDQGSGHISEKTFNELHCLKVFPGDLMISRLNEPIGRACIVPDGEPCYVVAVDNVILRPNKEYDRKFIMYAMNTEGYAEHGNMIARGATMSRVSRSQLGQFWLAFPGITEQRAIADFLDAQCAKIDSVIADIEKQIETLQKYKKSLITETVTKGLDKSVPMKDSGIKWIGKIPTHWNVKRIKHIIQKSSDGIKVGPFGSALTNDVVDHVDGAYKIYGQANLIRRDFAYGDNYVTKETYQRLINYVVLPGDIALSMMGTIGKCCVVPSGIEPGIMDSHLIKIRLSSIMLPKFFEYVYESDVVYEQLLLNSKGSIMNGLNSSVVKNVFMPLPSLDEQKELLIYLENSTTKIDSLLTMKQQQLEKLQQHKKSLIYEYVTGKKRVTEVN